MGEAVEEGLLHRRKPQLKLGRPQECAEPGVQVERAFRPKGSEVRICMLYSGNHITWSCWR